MKYAIAFHIDSVPFSAGVIAGTTSLGGSESACVGLARALAARGHDVHIFTTQLDEDAEGPDHAGVTWHPWSEHATINTFLEWDVFVGLRMTHCFQRKIRARLRILWNQDLLIDGPMKLGVMGNAWAYDQVVYVSQFHRRQWEELVPELKPFGYVTRNGFDPAIVPNALPKDPTRIIHISRPERGLRPILEMWPALKARVPDATLHLCRYSSMYDAHGWGEVCKAFDRSVAQMQQEVGGIVQLGELGKSALYQAIASSAVMWYPGVSDFAESSCIAAIEAQACSTPFVGSFKGALPETVPSGILIKGQTSDEAYRTESLDAVVSLLDGCRRQSFQYRKLQQAGREHVKTYTYAAIAEEWETWLGDTFRARYAANKLGVLRQLLHYDDHVAAKIVAREIVADEVAGRTGGAWTPAEIEAERASILCDRVIAGKEQTAEHYAERAADPILEAEQSMRVQKVVPLFAGCTHVLDIACGPGAFSLALAKAHPTLRVTGIDYAAGNIASARTAAETYGVADRCTFIQAAAYDFATQAPCDLWHVLTEDAYDGAFVGEFLEHVWDAPALIESVERLLVSGSPVVITVPYGPLGELIPRTIPIRRGHVHHFGHADLAAVFGQKDRVHIDYLAWGGLSPRGESCGNWIVQYRTSGAPTGQRPYADLIVTTRPKVILTVGIIAKDAELEIGKCLDSVWGLADAIVIGDCGSTDQTAAIAAAFDAGYEQSKIRVLTLPPVAAFDDGFAGARNAVLAEATGDVFLWIDTDETLLNGTELSKYVEGGPFIGYALRQTHLMIDDKPNWDTPIRLFRRRPDIQFYGTVHEQPEQGDCNTDIQPSLELSDVVIAHTGYLTEGLRRDKMIHRNRALLLRDQVRFPDRRLGKVLWIREFVNMADLEREEHGAWTPNARRYFQQVVGLFEKYFADPADKYHALARPFYERAVKEVNGALQVEIALAGKSGGGLGTTHAKPSRVWVRTYADLQRLMDYRMAEIDKSLHPAPLRVDPYDPVVLTAETPQEEVAV